MGTEGSVRSNQESAETHFTQDTLLCVVIPQVEVTRKVA
ncbi:MAG: hypothetical protein UV46_C0034G0009 [Candidatus Gottesmanbacteria bacterium GW2011_GWC2_42_8]|nr:MAG: hypothetical protein UV46_C0034G0009 [Candidatus Gottesmanbacteria bacterium GW2011_GWC2_42_8]